MKFTLYHADCLEIPGNCTYPHKVEVTGKDALLQAVTNDYVCAEYQGNYYGTPKEYVQKQLDAGKDVILEIEYLGAFQVKKMMPQTLMLFATPPSAGELLRRLRARGPETEEKIQGRMRRSLEEIEQVDKYDYILLNDDLDTCVKETHQIIQNTKYAASRNAAFLDRFNCELKELLGGK